MSHAYTRCITPAKKSSSFAKPTASTTTNDCPCSGIRYERRKRYITRCTDGHARTTEPPGETGIAFSGRLIGEKH